MTASVRSNSFNLVPIRDLPRAAGAPCPLTLPGADPELLELARAPRAMLLRLRDRMRLFRTETRDFSDTELAEITRLGQIYLDVSSKLFPDDFSRDLKKLELDAECASCSRRAECAGAFHAALDEVFTRDDRRVRSILRGLKGAILDVGCGEGPYLAELEIAVAERRARYLGLDPDRGRVEILRSRYPWARFHVGSLGDFAMLGDREPEFDHVLLLRSYNHLPDPDAVISSTLELLRDGGTLLIVDNVAFGLVRTREHAERAQAGGAGFEHYRNETAERVHSRLVQGPFRLLERRDVGGATSNQWLLHYEKQARR